MLEKGSSRLVGVVIKKLGRLFGKPALAKDSNCYRTLSVTPANLKSVEQVVWRLHTICLIPRNCEML